MSDGNPLLDKRITYNSFAKIVAMCCNIALSSFYFGYCIVYLGTIPTQTIKELYNTDLADGTVEGIFNGIIPLGGLAGALSSKILISKLSRRQCLLVINALAFLAGFLIYIPNFYSFLVFRFGQGFCVGFYSAIVSLIIKELAPTEIAGTLGTLPQLNVTFGVFFGPLFTYVLKKATEDQTCKKFWWAIFGFTQITLIIQTILLLFVFPYQTPKYLLASQQEAQAQQLVRVIYKQEFVEEIMDEKRADLRSLSGGSADSQEGSVLSNDSMNVRQVRDLKITIIIAIHLAIMQQFSGINAIVVYGSKIAIKATSGELSLLMPSLINLDQVLTTFFTGYLLSKFGRKTLLTLGALFQGLATGIITLGFFLPEDNKLRQPLIIVGLFLFMAVFGLSLGPVVWLYIPEVVQPRIVPFSTAANWIIASAVIILFPILTDALPGQNPAPLFIFFTVWCIGSVVFNWIFLIQTKDKPERLIRQEYANKGICN